MDRRFACIADEMKNGTSLVVDGDPPIALFRTDDGDFFAMADTCTHEKWSLGEDSDLEGTEITCPLHLARFDLRTGEPLCLPATVALKTYDVEIDSDGHVYVLVRS